MICRATLSSIAIPRSSARGGRALAAAIVVLLAIPAPLAATQHLVRAGEQWARIGARLRPGDEVILMPGRHRAATIELAHGSAERPIVFRSASTEEPATIEASAYGLRFIDPQHVQIRDLIIEGAKTAGLAIEGPAPHAEESAAEVGVNASDGMSAFAPPDQVAGGTPKPTDASAPAVSVSGVVILDSEPSAARRGIDIRHVDGVEIRGCRIEGWATAAIDIVGARDVRVIECSLIGRHEIGQMSGVRVRAGSRQVEIIGCRFQSCGDQGVSIGSSSALDEFRPPLTPTDAPGSRFEATEVEVVRSIFRDGRCAAAFVNCSGASLQNCTIVRPRTAVVSVRREQQDPRVGASAECSLTSNLIVWEPGDLRSFGHVGPRAEIGAITLGENLWWSPSLSEELERIGPYPGRLHFDQISDIDPRLDGDLRPTVPEAVIFGAFAP